MERLPDRLLELLQAELPLKVGRGVKQDVVGMARLGCTVDGAVELPGKESLKALARTVAGLRPPEENGWMTNWGARKLDDHKLRYAAFDAFAAVKVFEKLPTADRMARARSPPMKTRSRRDKRKR